MKIRLAGAELSMRAGGRTHVIILIVAFRNFAKGPTKHGTSLLQPIPDVPLVHPFVAGCRIESFYFINTDIKSHDLALFAY